jgi:DNA-binding transcriptional MerR regulator
MSKAAEAFRTISEVADELDVQKHVLRFWEARFPQVRPMKRGGGRRYYRPEDMELLRGIRHLLHAEGYTIKGVQKILREHGIDHVKQHGRPVQQTSARRGGEAEKRSAHDARALPANVPALPIGGRQPASGRGGYAGTERGSRRPGTGRNATAAENRALLEAALKELAECRRALLELARQEEPVRAPRRARAAGS